MYIKARTHLAESGDAMLIYNNQQPLLARSPDRSHWTIIVPDKRFQLRISLNKMRRSVGLGAVALQKKSDEKFKDKKSEIDLTSVDELQVQLDKLKDKLEWFAAKHQHVLKTDPIFRQEFIHMCATIGVDPLASSKGFWTEFLGVGTFYYQLAVQCIEIVLSGADYHGGVMRLEDLWKQLIDSRSAYLEDSRLSCNDVIQAFDMLECIGTSACGVIRTDSKENQSLVFCVPEELSHDTTIVIKSIAQSGTAYFTVNDLQDELGWPQLRVNSVVEKLLRDGIIWLDAVSDSAKPGSNAVNLYWVPGLFFHKLKTDAIEKSEF